MRNFLKMAEGVDIGPLLYAIMRQPELWNKYTVRANYAEKSPHRDVDDLILRYNKFEKGEDFIEKVCSDINVVNYPPLLLLPQARSLIFGLMQRVEGEHLGRVIIARLHAGAVVPPHSDRIPQAEAAFPDKISPALYYDRYHIVLKSNPGVLFKGGDETVYMAPGEVWWFNNTQVHEVINNSTDDRIHMIVDIRSSTETYEPK